MLSLTNISLGNAVLILFSLYLAQMMLETANLLREAWLLWRYGTTRTLFGREKTNPNDLK